MKSKPTVPKTTDDKEQSERFIDTAQEHEAADTPRALDDVFKKLSIKRPRAAADYKFAVKPKKAKKSSSV